MSAAVFPIYGSPAGSGWGASMPLGTEARGVFEALSTSLGWLGEERPAQPETCPLGHGPGEHHSTDVVCRRDDRLLPYGSLSPRRQLHAVDALHLPVFVMYLLARDHGMVVPFIVLAFVMAVTLLWLHLRHYAETRAVQVVAFVAVALVAAGWTAGDRWPTGRGLVLWSVVPIAALLSLHLRATVGDTGAQETTDRLVRPLWMDDEGEPRAAGARATVGLFVATVGLVGCVPIVARWPTSLAGPSLFLAGAAALSFSLAVLLRVAATTRRAWIEENNPGWPYPPTLPTWAQTPPTWFVLEEPWRSERTFPMRIVQSACLLLPRYRNPPPEAEPISTGKLLLVLMDSCIRYGSVSLVQGFRFLVAPVLASLATVVAVGFSGRGVARALIGVDTGQSAAQAVCFGAAGTLSLAVVVWLATDESLRAVLRGVVRAVLVFLPNTAVRLGAFVTLWSMAVRLHVARRVDPVPLHWVLVLSALIVTWLPLRRTA